MLRDLYPYIIGQFARAPRNLIRLQLVSKQFYSIARELHVRTFHLDLMRMETHNGKSHRATIRYTTQTVANIYNNLIEIRKYPWRIATNISNFYTIYHNNLPFRIRVQYKTVALRRGRARADISITMGKYIIYLQIINNEYKWIRGIRYRPHHTMMINFIRSHLPDIYDGLTGII